MRRSFLQVKQVEEWYLMVQKEKVIVQNKHRGLQLRRAPTVQQNYRKVEFQKHQEYQKATVRARVRCGTENIVIN